MAWNLREIGSKSGLLLALFQIAPIMAAKLLVCEAHHLMLYARYLPTATFATPLRQTQSHKIITDMLETPMSVFPCFVEEQASIGVLCNLS